MERTDFSDPRLVAALKEGKVVALPTETVYGLGVLWDDEKAYERLVAAKRRRPDKAIACMVSDDFDLAPYFLIDEGIDRVRKRFLPGPLTILVRAKEGCPFQSHLGTGICGLRIPAKKDLLSFLSLLKKPLQVTSANLSGSKALTAAADVEETFRDNEDIAYLVEGRCDRLVPSTVVDLSHGDVRMIREGEISLDSIKETYYGKH